MKLFKRRHEYDRIRILEEAARARSRRQRRRAISLYRWVLAVERNNVELHAKLAPLLAETGQEFDAWVSYRSMAQGALREGRDDHALAIYREATRALPREIQAWQGLARMLTKRGEDDEAVDSLVEGSRQYRAHWNRAQAIHLLRRARSIQPWHFETILELARHLARADQRDEARLLLHGLAGRTDDARLRRVRAAEFGVSPGATTTMRWLATWLRKGVEPVEARVQTRAGVVPLRLQPERPSAALPELQSAKAAGAALAEAGGSSR